MLPGSKCKSLQYYDLHGLIIMTETAATPRVTDSTVKQFLAATFVSNDRRSKEIQMRVSMYSGPYISSTPILLLHNNFSLRLNWKKWRPVSSYTIRMNWERKRDQNLWIWSRRIHIGQKFCINTTCFLHLKRSWKWFAQWKNPNSLHSSRFSIVSILAKSYACNYLYV